MKISNSLKKQIQYELKQNNKTNTRFSDIASNFDLNKKSFLGINKENSTYRFFTVAFLLTSIFSIVMGYISFNGICKIEAETSHQLEIFQKAYFETSNELEESQSQLQQQALTIAQIEAMKREIEKEFILLLGAQHDETYSISPNYVFIDELTYNEKKETIEINNVIEFNKVMKIDISEDEYLNIYLNMVKSNNSSSNKIQLLSYKAFFKEENNLCKISFLINSSPSTFTLENKTLTNVCNFVIAGDKSIIVKMTLTLNNGEFITKDIEISNKK